jgi:hypothetical protein
MSNDNMYKYPDADTFHVPPSNAVFTAANGLVYGRITISEDDPVILAKALEEPMIIKVSKDDRIILVPRRDKVIE